MSEQTNLVLRLHGVVPTQLHQKNRSYVPLTSLGLAADSTSEVTNFIQKIIQKKTTLKSV